jgi:hypothetical protein
MQLDGLGSQGELYHRLLTLDTRSLGRFHGPRPPKERSNVAVAQALRCARGAEGRAALTHSGQTILQHLRASAHSVRGPSPVSRIDKHSVLGGSRVWGGCRSQVRGASRVSRGSAHLVQTARKVSRILRSSVRGLPEVSRMLRSSVRKARKVSRTVRSSVRVDAPVSRRSTHSVQMGSAANGTPGFPASYFNPFPRRARDMTVTGREEEG